MVFFLGVIITVQIAHFSILDYLCRMTEIELKQKVNQGVYLPLMEAFYTLQGEGYHKGSAAYFIRIGGCDVGCHWCDVKESWDAQKHPPTGIESIVQEAKKWSNTVVVTGGEPLMWPMYPLTTELKSKGIITHIETSGAYNLSGAWDWFCLSPKKTRLPTPEAYKAADELKMIIHNQNDFKFAEEQAALVGEDCILFLQPEWSKREQMMLEMVDYVLKNPRWKVSLQTHKYLNIP